MNQKPLEKNEHQETTNFKNFMQIAEEIICYCQLLAVSQQRASGETTNFREAVAHLRSIFDESTARERRHIDTLTHFPKILKVLDNRYYQLKDRAKALIKECQEDKENHGAAYEAAMSHLQDVETELFSTKSIIKQQSTELAHLEEIIQNQKSAVEVVELKTHLEKLERQNKELEAEKKLVERQVSDLQDHVDTLTKDGGFDTSRHLSIGGPDNLNSSLNALSEARLNEASQIVESLKSQLARERHEFELILRAKREEAIQVKQDAEHLLVTLERLKGEATT